MGSLCRSITCARGGYHRRQGQFCDHEQQADVAGRSRAEYKAHVPMLIKDAFGILRDWYGSDRLGYRSEG